MSAHVQGEPANYHFRFAQACFVSIVFGTACRPGQEFDDDVTSPVFIVLFIGHLAEEIPQEDVGLAVLPFVNHGIGAEIQGILSQVIQVMVEP